MAVGQPYDIKIITDTAKHYCRLLQTLIDNWLQRGYRCYDKCTHEGTAPVVGGPRADPHAPAVAPYADTYPLCPRVGRLLGLGTRLPPPPPPPGPPGPLSYQGSMATGHTYGGAEGARKFVSFPLPT